MDIAGLADFSRRICAEGTVLLKNDGDMLPLRDQKVNVFGRTQINYYKSGTGSGGAVNVRRVVNIIDGLRENPHIEINEELADLYKQLVKENPADYSNTFEADFSDKEIELNEETVKKAREFSENAVIVIGRVSGESYDNQNIEGSWLLTRKERALIEQVKKYFDKIAVVINCGNIIDLKWTEEYGIRAVAFIWQGGQYGGKAVADMLSGDVSPSGRLADTIAYNYEDYPSAEGFGDDHRIFYKEDIYVGYRYFETFAREKVMYPFGYGLSYTRFSIDINDAESSDGRISVTVNVRNTGEKRGKGVVQVYFAPPSGKLGRPARELIAFGKTHELEPGAHEMMTLSFAVDDMAAYDDSGVTGEEFCYVLEKGDYEIYVGKNVRDSDIAYVYNVKDQKVVKRCRQAMAPVTEFERLVRTDECGVLKMEYEKVPLRRSSMEQRIEEELPAGYEITGDKGIKLRDVYNGNAELRDFTAQFSKDDLASIVRGEGMLSPKVTPGTASCFGGVTDSLTSYGIPPCSTADGPSGIRMDCNEIATNLPCGTLQACTWNTDIVEQMYRMESIELSLNKIDAQLGPGMNIHRNPLCGRNFEYFSEDPVLTGNMAAAVVKGIQAGDCSAVIKHFACNNQEYERNKVESILSERALREIYLKGFEIAVKTASPRSVMTSYNPINGKWSASNYDLTTLILREEWGFDGMVMTDWWATMNKETGGEMSLRYKSAMVRAQNDIHMCTDNFTAGDNSLDDIMEELENGGLTVGELQRCAENICSFIMKTPVFLRGMGVDETSAKDRMPDIAKLDNITVNGDAIKDFDPYVTDYYVEDIENIDCECSSYEMQRIGDIVEIVVRNNDSSTIYHVIKGSRTDEEQESNSSELGEFFVSNNCTLMCNIDGKAGTSVKCNLMVKQDGKYSIYIYASSDESELAQIAVFIKSDDTSAAASVCGTNGELKNIKLAEIELTSGKHDFEMSFGSSNFADIKIKNIQFLRE